MNAEQRIREYYQSFFITEPVLFACVTSHRITRNNNVKTLRVGDGKIEYNEKYIDGLSKEDLKQILIFEAFRILCKHPYERKRQNAIANQIGSNVTVQEYLATQLEMPKAREAFENLLEKNRSKMEEQFMKQYDQMMEMDDSELEAQTGMTKAKLRSIKNNIPNMTEEELYKRHFEFYYNLVDSNLPEMISESPLFEGMRQALSDSQSEGESNGENEEGEGQSNPKDHFDPMNAMEQTAQWGQNDLVTGDIDRAISDAQVTQSWGTVPGNMQEMLIASLTAKVDYRAILKNFRASVMSAETVVNRMRPSRRYGFGFPGKKREFTTKLAFFVDVSGSMTNEVLQNGFGIINKFFKYGIKETDVYQFDTELKDETPMKMHKARKEIKLLGRGGTDFQVVLDKLSTMPNHYDGVIVYTDGWAARPKVPKNVKTKNILWLFDTEDNYNEAYKNLKGIGRAAYVKSDREY